MNIAVVGLVWFLVPTLALFVIYWRLRHMEMARGPAILIALLGGLFVLIVWVGGLGTLLEYLDKTPKE